MAVKVGIPRGLLYYKYGFLWKSFLEYLGAEVVISPKTNKRMFVKGSKYAETELCAPVKVYYGHAVELAGKVDRLLVPRVVSISKKEYTCPKFLGLPDLVRSIGTDLPPLEVPVFDKRNGRRAYLRNIIDWGSNYSHDKFKIRRAWRKALADQGMFHHNLALGYLPDEIIEGKSGQVCEGTGQPMTIAVVGHSYNVFDQFISLNLINKMRKRGIRVLTPEVLPPRAFSRFQRSLPKKLFWTYEKEVYGAACHWLRQGGVDGIIYVLSFACGPDSLIQVLIEKEAKKNGRIPLMSVVIDEHSAEAGLMTRIEAFLDMIEFKQQKERDRNSETVLA